MGDTNATACVNTYQYLTLDPSSFVGFDVILGDAFLRNVYASYVSCFFLRVSACL